jgi:hypothetical protein
MSNLVLGMAFGYALEKIKPFVMSLRQYYKDDILFVLDNVNPDLEKFFETYGVYTFIPSEPLNQSTCQINRYEIYLDCINEHFPDTENILIADVRDVVFQADPFIEYPKKPLEFFAEPELFKNCQYNAPWVAGIYGISRIDQIKDEYVICSGTTMGTRAGMIEYLKTMVAEFSRLSKLGRHLRGGEDQPVHNHLIYSNNFSDFNINQNGVGPICTMHHSKILSFNRLGQLLNDDGSVIPVVHQYDRCGPMSVIFLKNALNVSGKTGIRTAASYAADNFPEHQLG